MVVGVLEEWYRYIARCIVPKYMGATPPGHKRDSAVKFVTFAIIVYPSDLRWVKTKTQNDAWYLSGGCVQ